MSIKISVVVPVYNVEQYLEKCLNSLVAQCFSDYEILIVDDGSVDKSNIICDQYEKKYPIIKVYHKKNGGLSSARNYGVDKAKGQYITFVDSDDYVSNTYLLDLWNLMEKFHADMACTMVTLQTIEESRHKHQRKFDDFVVDSREAFFEVYIRKSKSSWSACGKLIPKEILLKYPFPQGFYEEMASTYLHLSESHKIAFGDYSDNYHYIQRDGSITNRTLSKEHFRVFEVCDEITSFLNEKYPENRNTAFWLYQNAVLQLLLKLRMTTKNYNKIFKRYRGIFRKNAFELLQDKSVTWKSKFYLVMLCTTPNFFRIQAKVYSLIRGR